MRLSSWATITGMTFALLTVPVASANADASTTHAASAPQAKHRKTAKKHAKKHAKKPSGSASARTR